MCKNFPAEITYVHDERPSDVTIITSKPEILGLSATKTTSTRKISEELDSAQHYTEGHSKTTIPVICASSSSGNCVVSQVLHYLDSCEARDTHSGIDVLYQLKATLNTYRSICSVYGAVGLTAFLQQSETIGQLVIQSKTSALRNSEMSDHILNSTSTWVGRQFGKLNSQVQEKVTKFKEANIESIQNLPDSRTMCESLFPLCMRRLFEEWLGVSHLTESVSEETPQTKKSKPQPPDIYPFIQLILEFANNSLLSGVAHVVFTRLLVG